MAEEHGMLRQIMNAKNESVEGAENEKGKM